LTVSAILAEVFFCLIGATFILVGLKALRDTDMTSRIPTAIFWFILAGTFILGPYVPNWVTGVCVIAVAALTAFGQVKQSKSDVPDPQSTLERANKVGLKVFIPPMCLAVIAVLSASFFPGLGANNAIGISAVVALVAAFVITRAPVKYTAVDGSRLMDSVGPVGILPQLLAALGALFTAAGVGNVIANGVSTVIPDGNRFIAVAVYCIGMALFTVIMGNGFAAFSVITVGIGIPFLIMQGADPAVVGALGMTAGYCGTLLTPMAANFNIMPAALLETKNKYVIIKSQIPVAVTMLVIHIFLMYFLAFQL
jgi:uncharacterized membrane protein